MHASDWTPLQSTYASSLLWSHLSCCNTESRKLVDAVPLGGAVEVWATVTIQRSAAMFVYRHRGPINEKTTGSYVHNTPINQHEIELRGAIIQRPRETMRGCSKPSLPRLISVAIKRHLVHSAGEGLSLSPS